MNHKVWLTVFGVVAALLIGGGAFYAISSYGKYSDALSSWDTKVGTIESLERKVPYPNKSNAEALEEKVAKYKGSVQSLYQSLNSYQRPLNVTLAATEFQQLVKNRVQEFRGIAKSGGLAIESTEEFQLGFDSYSSSIPPPELVPVLDYELEAIDHLLRELVVAGAESLTAFERDPIPGEAGMAARHESGVVHKYPIRLQFQSGYSAYQQFINSIANDKNFFYIVRVLKVENEVKEGPFKQTDDEAGATTFYHSESGEQASYDELVNWGQGTASSEEIAAAAAEDGYAPSTEDARVLMGQEKLNVYMVVDIVRFLSPEEVSEAGKQTTEDSGSSKRR
tara:strand:- start:2320 stop:3330 length:1011 start_codon:yes stop_codon:yes gene_type:complete